MRRMLACLFVLSLFVLVTALPAQARKAKADKDIPDLTGVWKGTTQSVAVGKLGHTEPTETPKFVQVEFTLTIEKQDGPNFYGVRSTAKGKEVLLGVIHGTKVSMVDDDGTLSGRLTSSNKMTLIYLEPGTNSKVASITVFTREAKAPAAGQ